jgi:hypothetical protein
MRYLVIFILLFLLTGCYSTLQYGYLPGGDYKYYSPISPVNLNGVKYRLEVVDNRKGFNISCVNFRIDRNTELEGATGYNFFSTYVRAMIEANKGIIDPISDNILRVELTGLSAQFYGYGFYRIYGLVEFNVSIGEFQKNYCSAMMDGDKDAPLGKYSVATRKDALRKIVSGSARRTLENLMHDLKKINDKKMIKKYI